MKKTFVYCMLMMAGILGAAGVESESSANLVAKWEFEEGQGDVAVDSSANKFRGKLVNVEWKSGPTGKCLFFNGKNAYMEILHAPQLNLSGDFTISVKINPMAVDGPTLHVLIGKNGNPWDMTNAWALWFTNRNGLHFQQRHGGEKSDMTAINIPPVEPGRWYEVRIIKNGDTLSAYLDGTRVSVKNGVKKVQENNSSLFIGGDSKGHRPFWGYIDDLRIYNCPMPPKIQSAAKNPSAQTVIPVLAPGKKSFSFLLLSDLHYSQQNNFKTRNIMKKIVRYLNRENRQVDFVVHSGDLIQAHPWQDAKQASTNQAKAEWKAALADLKENFSVPVFITLGNHDVMSSSHKDTQTLIREYYLPWQGRELGQHLNSVAYSFQYGNSYFILAGYKEFQLNPAALAFEYDRGKKQPGVENIFVVFHNLLRPVSGIKFNDRLMCRAIEELPGAISAYFCGHVHLNEIAAWDAGDKDVLQIVSVQSHGRGKLNPTLTLDQERTLLIPRAKIKYYYGYPPSDSFMIISVDGKIMTAEFYSLDHPEVIRKFSWQLKNNRMEIRDIVKPEVLPTRTLSETDLKAVTAVELHFFHYLPGENDVEIRFNGVTIGKAPTRHGNWLKFHTDSSIPVPPELLRPTNSVEFIHDGKIDFAVRDVFLEMANVKKTKFRTAVVPKVFLSSERLEKQFEIPGELAEIGFRHAMEISTASCSVIP